MRPALLTLALLLTSAAGAVRLSAPTGAQPLGGGQPLTLVFGLHNDTAVGWQGQPTLDLPPGWSVLFPPEEVRLAPGEDTALLLPVSAPPSVAAGVYAVRLNVEGVQATATIHVAERRSVEVRELPGEAAVLDGKVQASFLVRNTGNVAEPLEFSVDAGTLTLSPSRLTLGPGEQVTVVALGTLPPRPDGTYRLTFKAQGRSGLTRTLKVTRTALLSELPLEERALTLRGQLEFGAGPALQTRLSLQGRLHPDLPGTFQLNVSDTSWNARYQEQPLGFGVGHLVQGGLRLQPGVTLFGVSGNVTRNGWRATASAGAQDGSFAGGVTLGYTGEPASVTVGAVTSAKGTTLAADIAARRDNLQGWASGALDLTSGAPRLEAGLAYQDRRTALNFSAQYRAPDFAGQAGGDLTVRATARQQLRPGVTATLTGRYRTDPTVPNARSAFTVAGHLATRTGLWASALGISGRQVTDLQFGYRDAHWNTSLAWTPQNLSVQGTATLPVGAVTLRPTLGATLDLHSAQLLPVLGVQASWASGRKGAALGVLSPTAARGPWSVTAGMTVPVRQADVTLSGSVALGAGQPRTQLRAALTQPLEIVTARRADVGTLEGHLRYPDGRPLAGVRVRAGQLVATTDGAGRFVFPDVPQGTVNLDVVDRDVAAGLRARPALPLKVDLRGGQTSTVSVRFSPGATLRGRIVLAWPDPAAVAGTLVVPDAPALSALTLRLTGPDLAYETPVNPDGTFTFSGVQAGTYRALLSLSGQTPLTTARLGNATVEVPDAGTVPVTLDLLPVTQELQIEDGGDLTVK